MIARLAIGAVLAAGAYRAGRAAFGVLMPAHPGDLDPGFRAKLDRLLSDPEVAPYGWQIVSGFRNPAAQLAAYNAGNSTVKAGFHNATLGGKPASLAVDVLPFGTKYPNESDPADMLRFAVAFRALRDNARRYGLKTGGEWSRRGAFAPYDLGWDPGHIEPSDYTLAQARADGRIP